MQAIEEFEDYLNTKIHENKEVDNSINKKFDLNDRQKQLIHYLVSDNNPSVSITSHALLNKISRNTSTIDLKYLLHRDLVRVKRSGKYVKYYATDKLLKEFGLMHKSS